MSDSSDRYSGKPGRFGEQRGEVRRVTLSIPDKYADELDNLLTESGVNYDDAHYTEYTYQNSKLAEYVLDVLKNHVEQNGDE